MAQTKLANVVNPEVLSAAISAKINSMIKFLPLAKVDTTLQGQAGDTITIPTFNYIGDADDLTEGVAMGTVVLTTSTKQVQIKEAGKAVEITDKAINSGYGDPVGEAETQLLASIAQKVDRDFVAALGGATLTYDGSAATISYNAILDAGDKFGDEDDVQKILFIHPNQKAALRKDPNFFNSVANAYLTGVVGEVAGVQVVASNKVPFDGTNYTNFMVKPGALGFFKKTNANVETDRDILARTNVISAYQHYAAALVDESKAVKMTIKG